MGGVGSGKFHAGTEVIKTTVMSRRALDPSDPTVRLAVIDAKKLTDGEWLRQVLDTTVEYVKVFRRGLDGVYREATYEIRKEGWGEGDTLRGYLWQMSGKKLGTFRLQAIYKGEVKSQKVVSFDTEDQVEEGEENALDVADRTLARVTKQIGIMASVKNMKDQFGIGGEGGEDDMKPEDLAGLTAAFAQMATAMGGKRDDTSAELMKGIIDNQRMELNLLREELKEQRGRMETLHLDLARRDGTGQTSVLDTLLTLVKDKGTPELIAQLITGRGVEEAEPTWLKVLRGLSEAPALQDLFQGLGIAMRRQLEKAGGPRGEAVSGATASGEAGAGDQGRVNNPTSEQGAMTMGNAKELLDEIKEQLRGIRIDPERGELPEEAAKVYESLIYFLNAIPMGSDGGTLLGRIQSLALTSERLARFAVKQMDGDLADVLWPQTRAFLQYVKGKVEEEGA